MSAQISVGVVVGDATATVRGDFDDVPTRNPKTGVEAASVNDFKDCIIADRRWTRVVRGDITIMGPYESTAVARTSFATAPVVGNKLPIASIQRGGAEAYVVARVASGVDLETGA